MKTATEQGWDGWWCLSRCCGALQPVSQGCGAPASPSVVAQGCSKWQGDSLMPALMMVSWAKVWSQMLCGCRRSVLMWTVASCLLFPLQSAKLALHPARKEGLDAALTGRHQQCGCWYWWQWDLVPRCPVLLPDRLWGVRIGPGRRNVACSLGAVTGPRRVGFPFLPPPGHHAGRLGGHHVLRHGRALLLQLHLLHPPHHREWPRGDGGVSWCCGGRGVAERSRWIGWHRGCEAGPTQQKPACCRTCSFGTALP